MISKMICMCRGRMDWIIGSGHFSRASGISVWLVYPITFSVISHASSQPSPSRSMRMRIISGIESDGWVSLSCIAANSGKWLHDRFCRLNRRTMSASEQATKKYCCFRRSSLPMYSVSLG